MSIMFGFLGVLGFVFGVAAYTQLEGLKKRIAALEAQRTDPRQ
jgi:hypothetical protein